MGGVRGEGGREGERERERDGRTGSFAHLPQLSEGEEWEIIIMGRDGWEVSERERD